MPEVTDILAANLKILFIGFNPGNRSAETGHHFAGHSNRFWKLLYESGLTPIEIRPENDNTLLALGYGITNIVARPSRTAAEITREEYQTGRILLREKLSAYHPIIACYTGIGVYKQFAQITAVSCGVQHPSVIADITDFVVPSPSGLNRIPFNEQLTYYQQLRQLLADNE